MPTLYLGFEEERELRICRVVGSVLGTLREEEYLVAEVDPPFSGDYCDREEPISQVILAVRKFSCPGGMEAVERHYFHNDDGVQEVIAALRRGEVPTILLKTQIAVECVISAEPLLTKKIDERRLKKIGWGSIHTDPKIASGRTERKQPGPWTFLWWRFRDWLEAVGLVRERH